MLRKIATLETLEAYRVPAHADARALRKAAHRVSFEYTPRPGYLYVRSRAISSRCNDNFDEFPAEEIKKAYRTFVGKPVFVNHHNDDHKRMRGVIIDAALHEDRNPDGTPDTWAEVLMEVDAKTFPKLAKAILAGEVDRTSMGCDVQLSVCSACGNKATNPAEYCQHIPAMKGQRIFRMNASSGKREGHLVREICYGLGFFENSLLVEEPADPTAYFLGVDDRGVRTAAKQAVSDEEIQRGLGLPTAEQGHKDIVQDKAKALADGLMKPFYEPYGGEEGYNLHRQNEEMMALHRRYSDEGKSHGGEFHFDDEQNSPYYEIHHTNPQGKKTGWSIRHYADGPAAEIYHDATPDEAHEMFDIGDPNGKKGFGEWEHPADTFGHKDLKGILDHWHSGPEEETGGARAYLEGQYGDPRIRRYKRMNRLGSTHEAALPPGMQFTYNEPNDFVPAHQLSVTFKAGNGRRVKGGYIWWHPDDGKVINIQVPGKHQGKGLGSALWNRAHEISAQRGIPAPMHSDVQTPKGKEWASRVDEKGVPPMAGPGQEELFDVPEEYKTRINPKAYLYSPELEELPSREAAAGPKYPNPADHPFFKKNPVHHQHIVDAYEEADENTKAQGSRWYPDAHLLAKAIDPEGNAARGAGVLSAYSPQTSWPVNAMNAARSLAAGRAMQKGEGQIMASHAKSAQRIIDGEHHSEVFKGPKIRAFAHLIEHPEDDHHVVVDRHALSVAMNKRVSKEDLADAPLSTPHYYEHAANQYRTAAGILSERYGKKIKPHEVQATTWLVQQKRNAIDNETARGGQGKGLITRDKNDWNDWEKYHREHHPDLPESLHTTNPHRPKAEAALNDVVAPPEVDTLQDDECPVCGEMEVYDGQRCPVCGFVAPPEMFRDPDLEMAKQIDLRQTDNPLPGNAAPGQANPEVPGGGLVDPSQLGEDPLAEQLQHPDQLAPNGGGAAIGEPGTPGDGVPDLFCPACGEGFDAGAPLSSDGDPATVDATGPAEGQPCPNCGASTLLSPNDMQAMQEMGERPMEAGTPEEGEPGEEPGPDEGAPVEGEESPEQQETEGPPEQQEDGDSDDDAVDDEDQPSKRRDGKNPKGATRMSKSVEAALAANTAAVGDLMRELRIVRAQNELIAKAAGLEEQFAEIRRTADINNPASPVPDPGEEQAPETTEQAVTPEAADDPQRPGMTPGSVAGVPAQQVDTPLRPGVTLPTAPANQLVDVTAPVAGTNTGELSPEQTRIETDVRVGDPMQGAGTPEATAFPWTISSKDGKAQLANRTMASMRLAKLRIAAGLAPSGDEFALAAALETDASLSDVAMATEIKTLEAVGRTAAKQPRPAGLVPRAAAGERTTPSLAAQPVPVPVGGGYDDTADADLFF